MDDSKRDNLEKFVERLKYVRMKRLMYARNVPVDSRVSTDYYFELRKYYSNAINATYL